MYNVYISMVPYNLYQKWSIKRTFLCLLSCSHMIFVFACSSVQHGGAGVSPSKRLQVSLGTLLSSRRPNVQITFVTIVPWWGWMVIWLTPGWTAHRDSKVTLSMMMRAATRFSSVVKLNELFVFPMVGWLKVLNQLTISIQTFHLISPMDHAIFC